MAGKSGESGRAISERLSENIFILPSTLPSSDSESHLSFYRVYFEGVLQSSSQNRNSKTPIVLVSKECSTGKKVFSGSCKWDLMKYTSTDTWCLADDFNLGQLGCTDCVTSLATVYRTLNGEPRRVVTKVSIVDNNGIETKFPLGETSCHTLKASPLEVAELNKCGFFCFFQKTDPLYENETKFTCRYVPPTTYGVDLASPLFAGVDLDKLQVITVDLICS